ncbi:hypothetical protein [Salmonella enterica]|uniref:DUF551 domain-containing protein n=1 Tax=Salmonella enterica subsp. enterica serovar Reading TaxID=165302 RepID=A0A5V7H908_SALET|nr:hypothetical protein [Salmonella enterica]EAA6647923.1 hypothetical protein [Salmonella enterica subsp. enterica serovar Reading]EDQ6417746.1 hypothetical protein [Salmonella enterica subsp. enterica]HAT0109191.1 hypothetical protein [Salmonella enterica subsp. enterica serovar Saintpaul]EAB8321229.1 hypothetical protein [Salmonella enterica subsp. enterica serovar Typhimurium]EBQ9057831.1 hypothetical protein [Salmonella enterica subsp. enterica serovar Reading]
MTTNHPAHGPVSLDRLSLNDAIAHADERAEALFGPCAAQHAQLAAWLRELQERRKADSAEPVAWRYRTTDINGNPRQGWSFSEEASLMWLYQPLYATPPAQVVPENCVTAEQRRVIEMLLNVCGAAFELADDSCQQDVDGEECHVVPDDAFQKLSDALDEIENTLPTEDVDRPDVFLAWSAMPRAALKSILQAGNSPVIPDGWVMVPKEPTEAMNKAGWAAMNEHDAINPTYRAMLAAAPQQEVKS